MINVELSSRAAELVKSALLIELEGPRSDDLSLEDYTILQEVVDDIEEKVS